MSQRNAVNICARRARPSDRSCWRRIARLRQVSVGKHACAGRALTCFPVSWLDSGNSCARSAGSSLASWHRLGLSLLLYQAGGLKTLPASFRQIDRCLSHSAGVSHEKDLPHSHARPDDRLRRCRARDRREHSELLRGTVCCIAEIRWREKRTFRIREIAYARLVAGGFVSVQADHYRAILGPSSPTANAVPSNTTLQPSAI